MIDEILVMNLRRREDKWWFMRGALGVLGFPHRKIVRFKAHDGLDYPDVDALHRAAIVDGFLHFDDFRTKTPQNSAWYWTWVSALRHIQNSNKIALLLIDDAVPLMGWSWLRFQHLTTEAYSHQRHGDFRAIQLSKNTIQRSILLSHKPYSSMLHPGFAGCSDNGVILNAAGARLLLDAHTTSPTAPNQNFLQIAELGVDNPDYFEGLWHTLDQVVNTATFNWEGDVRRI